MHLLSKRLQQWNAGSIFIAFMGIATLPMASACGSDSTSSDPLDASSGADPTDSGMVAAVSAKNGLVMAPGTMSIADAKAKLVQAIDANDKLSSVADVNHAGNAASVDMELSATEVLLFGNPTLGTPLMQANQATGIDLPQKMLFSADQSGAISVFYNHPDYLQQRHGLQGVDAQLDTIRGALRSLAEMASGRPVAPADSDVDDIAANEGLVIIESAHSVDETYNRLKTSVENAEPLRVVAQLDHAANAASVGLDLRPTKLLIFGNPTLGTPLMQSERSIAIDLPQKVLVYEDAAGDVFLVYNDPHYLAKRHGVEGNDEVLDTIANALQNLANGATQP